MSQLDLSEEIRTQLREHWEAQLRPRLDGLTDAEYLWEPTGGCWSVRPRGQSAAPVQAGSGAFTIDFAFPEPDPPPVTTIAWRLAHLIVGVFGMRVAAHFDGPAVDYQSFGYAGTAAEALNQLDAAYTTWDRGIAGLDADALAQPCGPSEAYPDRPMVALVLHINREVIHHGAEIALLRDLYAWRHRNAEVGRREPPSQA